ncbi:MAG: D-aminoacyl-tRNA deacylase [Candidatus Nanoarchaeia archaeon]
MKLLVISKPNLASFNIGKFINKEIPKLKLETTDKSVLELDYLQTYSPKPELVVVPSTHKSEANVPMLNAHPTGNWSSDNRFGGKPKTLSIAPALYLAEAIKALRDKKEELKLNYEVGLEVTHHGPTIDLPVMFVEIGSSEKQWNDLEACKITASIISQIVTRRPEKLDVCVGFGGPHYAPQFTRKVLAGKFATGHICPKHHIDALDEEMVMQAINKTVPKPSFVALEWKGLKPEQRQKLIAICEKHKINWEKL